MIEVHLGKNGIIYKNNNDLSNKQPIGTYMTCLGYIDNGSILEKLSYSPVTFVIKNPIDGPINNSTNIDIEFSILAFGDYRSRLVVLAKSYTHGNMYIRSSFQNSWITNWQTFYLYDGILDREDYKSL